MKSPINGKTHSEGAALSLPVIVQNKNKVEPTALNVIHPVTNIIHLIEFDILIFLISFKTFNSIF